jgi:hypothetical protein
MEDYISGLRAMAGFVIFSGHHNASDEQEPSIGKVLMEVILNWMFEE